MSKFVGKRFGKLEVIEKVEGSTRPVRYLCLCDCGNSKQIIKSSLSAGYTKSCGCLRKETTANLKKSHGRTGTPEYNIWKSLRQRCNNPKAKAYNNYGGRGITCCPSWNNFNTFIKDMGDRPSEQHTIERLDNDLGYTSMNCVWASREEQSTNKRNTIKVSYKGEILLVKDIAKLINRTYFSTVKMIYRKYKKVDGVYYKEVSQ